ncbi:hypothetical protein CSPX01_08754 [Colletotrichum filicis]|nr:hypothetical protein CSPX01_08754 [Colletotrichum filicis]
MDMAAPNDPLRAPSWLRGIPLAPLAATKLLSGTAYAGEIKIDPELWEVGVNDYGIAFFRPLEDLDPGYLITHPETSRCLVETLNCEAFAANVA